MRNRTFLIVLILAACFSPLLFFLLGIGQAPNGFERRIEPEKIRNKSVFPMPLPNLYFAGHDTRYIYLKTIGITRRLFRFEKRTARFSEIDLGIGQSSPFFGKKGNIGLYGGHLFLTNRKGDVQTISLQRTNRRDYPNQSIRFDQSILFSPSLMGVRQAIATPDGPARRLSILNYPKGQSTSFLPLEKQIDGYFCTDGLLSYDPDQKRFFYMFFYRGRYLCLDTNMHLIQSVKTIDTVSRAQMELFNGPRQARSKRTLLTLGKPPKSINHHMSIGGEQLYILSALRADNEPPLLSAGKQVIDVYDSREGSYRYSFYLPRHKGHRPLQLHVEKKNLFAIFPGYLLHFRLR